MKAIARGARGKLRYRCLVPGCTFTTPHYAAIERHQDGEHDGHGRIEIEEVRP